MISKPTSTTIDIKPEIYHILLLKAQKTHKSISELVNEAINLYLAGAFDNRDKNNGSVLAKEARRQSLFVSKHVEPAGEVWEANIDDTDWRG
ncbi:MAG: hypothetical protein GY792_03015 [Gammaproteobacteria bacterium]|nr:hypothetical protein [Gammaproteobacteria bacterium]